MSQSKNKTYRKIVRKTFNDQQAKVAAEFILWLKSQPFRFRLNACWDIIRGVKTKRDSL